MTTIRKLPCISHPRKNSIIIGKSNNPILIKLCLPRKWVKWAKNAVSMRHKNMYRMWSSHIFSYSNKNVWFDEYCSEYYRNLTSYHTKKPKAMQLYLWCGQRKYKLKVILHCKYVQDYSGSAVKSLQISYSLNSKMQQTHIN